MGVAQIDPAVSFRESVLERLSCKEILVFQPRHHWSNLGCTTKGVNLKVLLLYRTIAAARMLTKRQSCWPNSVGNSMNNSPSHATNSSDAQLKEIGDKKTCTTVITGFDIISQLQNASNAFSTYIEEGLAEMEKNAAAGRTLSSVPMSMQTISLQKFNSN
ncbi:hypothetical protein MKW92_038483 [Papaver armeniacum]|nr:hypothetical protein MKW92_038483 [Papaver armeniacum]